MSLHKAERLLILWCTVVQASDTFLKQKTVQAVNSCHVALAIVIAYFGGGGLSIAVTLIRGSLFFTSSASQSHNA
jgi:hypothetical protein